MAKTNHAQPDPPLEPRTRASHVPMPMDLTLLELVLRLGATIQDDREVVAAARRMLRRGEIKLVGNFRGESTKQF